MINSVLKVSCTSSSSFGTCFAISSIDNVTHFLTCGHVVNNSSNGSLFVDSYPATIVKNLYDKGLDLALLRVDNLKVEPLSFCEPDESQSHEVIGFTNLGKDIKKEIINKIRIKDRVEIIKKTSELKINTIKIYTDEDISNGYSGAPIINSHSQKVIGIVSLSAGKSINFGIANSHINELFDIDIHSTKKTLKKSLSTEISSEAEYYIKQVLNSEFEECLNYFSSHNPVWNEPKLHAFDENGVKKEGTPIDLSSIIESPRSMIINARQQYGLSSLAKYLVKHAWERPEKFFWLYLDINEFKAHTKDIEKTISKRLKKFKLKLEDITCVVLDEASTSVKEVQKKLSVINDIFIDLPIIIMMSEIEHQLFSESIDFDKIRHFEHRYLWSLSRNEIRNVVTCYNRDKKYIDEDEPVINKLTSDLEVLNIPRTPLNCLTFLKIYEYNFDDTPINRTDMIGKVLYLLFNVDQIPKYKSRPDLKDVEFVLGYLCENFIREHNFDFSREEFQHKISQFCNDSDIDMEIEVIFEVLYTNGIIIQRSDRFCFKFSYWVLYFAAHRMHQNDDFADYVLTDMNYTSYPEIIEYYAGITRNSNKVLTVLFDDVVRTRKIVETKSELPENFDIYSELRWAPTDESLDTVKDMLESGAKGSRLPDEIKDHFADKHYDSSKPMRQSMHKILEEYSLLRLMRGIHSASKALRNSDYADSKLRHKLMSEIVTSWELIIKFQVLISPVICQKKSVTVEGAKFQLLDCFSGDSNIALLELIPVIPNNVISWFQDDVFSKKMGSFFYKNAAKHSNPLAIHTLALLVVTKRPIEWQAFISDYIKSLDKNSYYLSSICHELQVQYRFSFTSAKELRNIETLIKLTIAKHNGVKKLNPKEINKVSDAFIPNRVE